MFSSILQADLFSVVLIQVAVWLSSMAFIYICIRFSCGETADTEINPVDLFLALLSGESFGTLFSPNYSTE